MMLRGACGVSTLIALTFVLRNARDVNMMLVNNLEGSDVARFGIAAQ